MLTRLRRGCHSDVGKHSASDGAQKETGTARFFDHWNGQLSALTTYLRERGVPVHRITEDIDGQVIALYEPTLGSSTQIEAWLLIVAGIEATELIAPGIIRAYRTGHVPTRRERRRSRILRFRGDTILDER
jgi:hypothetical protein